MKPLEEVAIGTTSARSGKLTTSPTGNPTAFVLMADVECYVRKGSSAVVATTGSMRVEPNRPVAFTVHDERDSYIAVIQGSAGGTLQIWEGEWPR